MPRPNKGYTKIGYYYLKEENHDYIEGLVSAGLKAGIPDTSKSDVMNQIIERDRQRQALMGKRAAAKKTTTKKARTAA